MKFNEKLLSLPVGVAVFAFLALAGLVGILALNPAQPTEAQTSGCDDVGSGDARKGVCSFSYAENDTGQVGRLTTRELDQRQVVKVWELVTDSPDNTGFPDHGDFRIDRKSGELYFKRSPDYENPMSSVTSGTLAERNVYKVKAKLGDGEKFVYTEVTVQVTGVEEAETLTLSARQPEVDTALTATLSGGDIRGLRTPDWQWQVENGSGGWDNITDAVNRSYTPQDDDVGKKLRAYVSYQDSHDDDLTELGDPLLLGTGVSEFPVRAEPGSNVAPVFWDVDDDDGTAGIQTSRRIEENSPPGTKVGPPVFATDKNHLPWNHADDPGGPRDVLTYSLGDGVITTLLDGVTLDDGLFSIDQKTGQIMTRAPLNKEVGLTDRVAATDGVQLQVTANATDPSGEIVRALVTIHVLDVDEAPEVTGPAAITYFENQEEGSVTDLLLFKDPTQTSDDDPTPADSAETNRVTYMATDNDLDDDDTGDLAGGDIQWQITGDDADKFQFGPGDTPSTYTDSPAAPTGTPPVAVSPVLQFRSAPDLENAADEGGTPGDNVYEITVVAWDEDWEIGSRDVTIRVADSNDEGSITLSHVQPQAGVKFTATLDDPDGVSTGIDWTWETAANTDAEGDVDDSGLTSTYTPTDDDGTDTNTLIVTATYTDGGGRSETATITSTAVRPNPVTGDDDSTPLVDESGRNTAPTFYEDDVEVNDTTDGPANRVANNETTSYVRYVLENHSTQLTKTEREARVDTDAATDGIQVPTTGAVNVFDGYFENLAALPTQAAPDGTVSPDGTNGRENLQFDLSGADAKYFSISNAATPVEQRGLISTKRALDFETKSTYTVTVTATDPGGLTDTATVTIHVLDVPEVEGLEERYRVDENQKLITALSANNPPDVSLGGLKWSLLTTTATPGLETQTTTEHNRNDARSIDCHYDGSNEGLCDNFRFSNFNTANTTLLFAIGTGEDHDAPNFEKPSDRVREAVGDQPAETTNNVYKIVVRVAFANLRSQEPVNGVIPVNHPNPQDDEREDRLVWIRVDDVDEAPKFDDDATTRLIAENSDDDLPTVEINSLVAGTVEASDPEYSYEDGPGPQYGKKLTYSLDAGAYDNLFQIVPSTGAILTRSRLNYEDLSELMEMGPSGGQHRIITVPVVTATDSAMPMGNSADIGANIRVNDVNETPLPEDDLIVTGMGSFPDYAEEAATDVGSYRAVGENVASATWELDGADMDDFMLNTYTGAVVTLMFKSAPDYETPTDDGMDNTYTVTLTATVGGVTAPTRTVMVTVINADDPGTVTVTPAMAVVGTELTAGQPDDPDGGVTNVMWDWWIDDSATGSFDTQVGGTSPSTSPTYTPTAADEGRYLKARALYDDNEDTGKMALSMAIEVMSADPNQALIDMYDVDGDGLDRTDVIAAIHRYLGGDPDVTRTDVIALIRLYLAS